MKGASLGAFVVSALALGSSIAEGKKAKTTKTSSSSGCSACLGYSETECGTAIYSVIASLKDKLRLSLERDVLFASSGDCDDLSDKNCLSSLDDTLENMSDSERDTFLVSACDTDSLSDYMDDILSAISASSTTSLAADMGKETLKKDMPTPGGDGGVDPPLPFVDTKSDSSSENFETSNSRDDPLPFVDVKSQSSPLTGAATLSKAQTAKDIVVQHLATESPTSTATTTSSTVKGSTKQDTISSCSECSGLGEEGCTAAIYEDVLLSPGLLPTTTKYHTYLALFAHVGDDQTCTDLTAEDCVTVLESALSLMAQPDRSRLLLEACSGREVFSAIAGEIRDAATTRYADKAKAAPATSTAPATSSSSSAGSKSMIASSTSSTTELASTSTPASSTGSAPPRAPSAPSLPSSSSSSTTSTTADGLDEDALEYAYSYNEYADPLLCPPCANAALSLDDCGDVLYSGLMDTVASSTRDKFLRTKLYGNSVCSSELSSQECEAALLEELIGMKKEDRYQFLVAACDAYKMYSFHTTFSHMAAKKKVKNQYVKDMADVPKPVWAASSSSSSTGNSASSGSSGSSARVDGIEPEQRGPAAEGGKEKKDGGKGAKEGKEEASGGNTAGFPPASGSDNDLSSMASSVIEFKKKSAKLESADNKPEMDKGMDKPTDARTDGEVTYEQTKTLQDDAGQTTVTTTPVSGHDAMQCGNYLCPQLAHIAASFIEQVQCQGDFRAYLSSYMSTTPSYDGSLRSSLALPDGDNSLELFASPAASSSAHPITYDFSGLLLPDAAAPSGQGQAPSQAQLEGKMKQYSFMKQGGSAGLKGASFSSSGASSGSSTSPIIQVAGGASSALLVTLSAICGLVALLAGFVTGYRSKAKEEEERELQQHLPHVYM